MIYKFSGVHIGSFAVVLAIMPLLVTAVIMIVNGNLSIILGLVQREKNEL